MVKRRQTTSSRSTFNQLYIESSFLTNNTCYNELSAALIVREKKRETRQDKGSSYSCVGISGHDDNGRDPCVLEDLLSLRSTFRIRVEHALDDVPPFASLQVGYRCRRRSIVVVLQVRSERRIRSLRNAPRELLKLEAVHDDGRSPNIDESCVVLYFRYPLSAS